MNIRKHGWLVLLFIFLASYVQAQNWALGPVLQSQDAPGVVIGDPTDYGPASTFLKSKFAADGGDFPGYQVTTSALCSGTSTATTWPTAYTDPLGYKAGFFVPGQFWAYNGVTGNLYGAGTITASTANTGSMGVTLSLNYTSGTATACVQAQLDTIFISAPGSMGPIDLFTRTGASISSDAVWNTTDTSPASTNTIHSLQLSCGDHIQLATDQGESNQTNPDPTLATKQVNNMNINGTYAQSFKGKCLAPSGTTQVQYSVNRSNAGQCFIGTNGTTCTPFIGTLNCSNSNGVGWQTISNNAVGTEDGTQVQGNLLYTITNTPATGSCTGPILLQDMDFIEQTQLAGGNPTVFSDDFVRYLQNQVTANGTTNTALRVMGSALWPSLFIDETGPAGNNRWGNVSNYIAYNMDYPLRWDDMLGLSDFLNTDLKITGGMFMGTAGYGATPTWLKTNAHYVSLAGKGKFVKVANGNEPFNAAAGGAVYASSGVLYGKVLGANVQAFRAASGYDANHMDMVGGCWWASGQLANFGFCNNVLVNASTFTNGRPKSVEFAPYNLGFVSTLPAFADMRAQINCWDTSTTCGSQSVQTMVNWINTHFGTATAAGPPVDIDIYEVQSGLVQATNVINKQATFNGVAAGVSEAETLLEHDQLMQLAGVKGWITHFSAAERFNGFSCVGGSCPSIVSPLWGLTSTPCGPGQLNTCHSINRPQAILQGVFNKAIGGNKYLTNSPCVGFANIAYPGGQPNGGTNTIPAFTYPALQCFAYTDQANHWTGVIHNNDLANPYTVPSPSSSFAVTTTTYPVSGEAQSANNEAVYIVPSSNSLAGDVTPTAGAPAAISNITVQPGQTWIGTWSTFAGNNWYVLKGATGSNAGTSWTNAWNELSQINWSTVACGDIVWLGGGTYTTSTTIAKSCTSGSPLTVQSVLSSDATPTSAAGYTSAVLNQVLVSNSSIDVDSGAYITLNGRKGVIGTSSSFGISMQCPSGNGCGPITVGESSAATNVTLTYLELYGPPCVTAGGVGEGTCTQGTHAVDHGLSSTTNLLMDHMWMHRFAEIVRPYQWTNYTIQYSDMDTTRETPAEHEDLMYAANPTSGTMRYNILWGSPNDGLFFDQGGNSLNFYGNVYYNSGGGYMIWDNDAGPNGVLNMYNNTFSSDESFGDFICPSNCPWIDWLTTFSSVTIENNIFDHVTYSGTPGTGNYNAYSTDIGKQDSGANSFTYTSAFAPSNLQFVTTSTSNPISANYQLTTTGQTTFSNGITLSSPYNIDPLGVTRGVNGSFTIGAYQTVSEATVVTPTFSPVAGTYNSTQSIAITTATSGATIYYTTDGSTPTTGSTVYSTAISIAASQTIKALGVKSGMTNSAIGTAAYTINSSIPPPTKLNGVVAVNGASGIQQN